MPLASVITVQPLIEPVGVDELGAHLRLLVEDQAREAVELAALIKTARQYVEAFTARQLIEATYEFACDVFPSQNRDILLPAPPLISVTTITYVDEDGAGQTLAASEYLVDTRVEPGRVRLNFDKEWPATRLDPSGIVVTYKAGYGTTEAAVPEVFRHAVRLLASHWYEHREAVQILERGQTVEVLPVAVADLLWPERILEVA